MSFSFAVREEEYRMKESVYKNYEELPLFLNAETVAKVLGVAPSTAYELMHEADFPTLRSSTGWLSRRNSSSPGSSSIQREGFSEASEVAKERPNQELFSSTK